MNDFFKILISIFNCFELQAESALDQMDWIEKITGVIASLLSSQTPERVSITTMSKAMSRFVCPISFCLLMDQGQLCFSVSLLIPWEVFIDLPVRVALSKVVILIIPQMKITYQTGASLLHIMTAHRGVHCNNDHLPSLKSQSKC